MSAVPKHPGARSHLESEGGTKGTCVPGHGSAVEKDNWALLQPQSQGEAHTTWLAILMCVYGGGEGSNSLVHLVSVGKDRTHPSHQRTVKQEEADAGQRQ